jgi:MFS family permease
VQGNFPLIWSAASEIKGRKVRRFGLRTLFLAQCLQPVYVAAFTIFVLAGAILANAQTIQVLIGMRVLQAAGSGISSICFEAMGSMPCLTDLAQQ